MLLQVSTFAAVFQFSPPHNLTGKFFLFCFDVLTKTLRHHISAKQMQEQTLRVAFGMLCTPQCSQYPRRVKGEAKLG